MVRFSLEIATADRSHLSTSKMGAMNLDMKRVREILDSPKITNVTYRGTPVHIDKVFETNGYVEVHFEDGTTAHAPARELEEI